MDTICRSHPLPSMRLMTGGTSCSQTDSHCMHLQGLPDRLLTMPQGTAAKTMLTPLVAKQATIMPPPGIQQLNPIMLLDICGLHMRPIKICNRSPDCTVKSCTGMLSTIAIYMQLSTRMAHSCICTGCACGCTLAATFPRACLGEQLFCSIKPVVKHIDTVCFVAVADIQSPPGLSRQAGMRMTPDQFPDMLMMSGKHPDTLRSQGMC